VQLVDLALSIQMLEFPHPLLAVDIDVERFIGGRDIAKKIFAPQKR